MALLAKPEAADLIGKGLTSEVYVCGAGRVLKLYYPWSPRWRAEQEFANTRAVHRVGFPAPEPFELVEIDDRAGIIFERIEGPSLLKVFESKPWQLFRGAKQLAGLHAALHQHIAPPELPLQRDQMNRWITAATTLSEEQLRAARDAVDKLAGGDVVCHGDFHPENILMTARGPVIIDWGVATHGNPIADVARTAALFEWGELPVRLPWHLRVIIKFSRDILRRVYLRHYFKLRGGSVADIEPWRPIQIVGRSAWLNSRVN
jgi:uncharacterized protein (TIGR02172 family)